MRTMPFNYSTNETGDKCTRRYMDDATAPPSHRFETSDEDSNTFVCAQMLLVFLYRAVTTEMPIHSMFTIIYWSFAYFIALFWSGFCFSFKCPLSLRSFARSFILLPNKQSYRFLSIIRLVMKIPQRSRLHKGLIFLYCIYDITFPFFVIVFTIFLSFHFRAVHQYCVR